MTEIGNFFKLSDIVEKAKNEILSLPTVQRGFVWKPYQIENLWDSLLRGYPVGSIVLSPTKNDKNKFEILDGQQRLSSICLGMYAPDESSDIFKTSYNNIRIFIDLTKPDDNDNRKYIFRVITRSHPWGYQRKDNQKTLESKDKRSFLQKFETNKNFFEMDIENFYPFDAYKPVPFEFFINSKNLNDVKSKIEKWTKRKINQNKIKNEGDKKKDKNFYSEKEIWEAVNEMKKNAKIPALYLNLSEMYNIGETNNEQNSDFDEENNNQRLDEVENMFVRLNAGGTPLSGEELNYSILKTHIDSTLQKTIENQCKGLFKPARFITIMYRLFEMQDKKKGNFYRLAIKPKVFQRSIKKSKNNKFVEFIKEILNVDKKKSNKPSLLATVKNLLTYEERTNKYGLPFITASRLSTQSPEVLFMLMYRLHIAEDGFCLQSDEHRKLLGIITLFSWLGKGEQRDHSQLLRNIFPTMIKLNPNRFWSWETVQRALLKHNGKEVLTHFPLIEKLKKEIRTIIKNNNGNYKSGIFEKINNEVYSFIGKIFWNKDLLTYSQRNYLSKEYENKYFMLDDTNVPFDWDHIFPHDFIRNKRGITQSLKDWYHSNGNFWACPYEFNRGAHDDPPCEKFKDKGCLDENCLKAASIDKEALENCNNIIDKDSLKENWKTVYEFILNRNLNLCEEWYNELEIDKLIPESLENEDIKKLFENIIKMMWKEIEEEGWQTYNLSIRGNDLKLYFHYYIEGDILEENGIEFGIYSEEDSGSKIIKNIKISKKLEDKYMRYENENETGIYNNFTLISYSENSKIDLFKSFNAWLKNFPDNKIKKMAIERFHKSIKKEHKKEILNKN